MIIKGKYDDYFFNDENLIKKIGKYNSVFKGKSLNKNKTVIIKKLNNSLKNNQFAVERLKNEAKFNLKHQNIVSSVEFIDNQNDYFLINDFVEGIDFKTFSKKNRKKLNEQFYIKALISCLEGLSFIHENDIIHRDIRPSNLILIFNSHSQNIDYENPTVKIIDFGLSKFLQCQNFSTTPFSMIYSPPEQVFKFENLVNASSDLYSLGISFYEIITKKIPFNFINPEIIINLQITQKLKYSNQISKKLFRIISKATEKYFFKIPPNKLDKNVLYEYLSEGQKKRYQSAKDMIEDLKKVNSATNIFLKKLKSKILK